MVRVRLWLVKVSLNLWSLDFIRRRGCGAEGFMKYKPMRFAWRLEYGWGWSGVVISWNVTEGSENREKTDLRGFSINLNNNDSNCWWSSWSTQCVILIFSIINSGKILSFCKLILRSSKQLTDGHTDLTCGKRVKLEATGHRAPGLWAVSSDPLN